MLLERTNTSFERLNSDFSFSRGQRGKKEKELDNLMDIDLRPH